MKMREMLWSTRIEHKEVDRDADVNSEMMAFLDNLMKGDVGDEGIR